MNLKRIKTLSTIELEKILGGDDPNDGNCDPGNCPGCSEGGDSTDCTSEAATGGSTTDRE